MTALGALEVSVAAARARLRPAVVAVLDALADDPLTAAVRASLAVAGLAWGEVPGYLSGLAARGELHPDALAAAALAVLRQSSRPDAAAGLATLEEALAADADERLRRIALAALVAPGSGPDGWSPESRSRLDAFRRDGSVLVAAAAQFTLLPPEDRA